MDLDARGLWHTPIVPAHHVPFFRIPASWPEPTTPRRARNDMPAAAESGELGLELRHFRTVDELAMGKHARDRLVDGFAEPTTLRGDVDQRQGLWTQLLVHGALQALRTGHRSATSRRRGAAPCAGWRLRRGLQGLSRHRPRLLSLAPPPSPAAAARRPVATRP